MSTIEKLNAEVAKAQTVVDQWEAKAADARAEAERIDREAGAQIIENPSAAEKITLKVQTLERTARAYDAAAAEARDRVRAVWRKHVEAEHREYEKLAATRQKDLERHQSEVGKLLDRLEQIDGVRYEPHLGHGSYVSGGVYHTEDPAPSETKGMELEALAGGAALQAKKIKFVLEHGRAPTWQDDPVSGSEVAQMRSIDTPPVTAAALQAGVL